MRLMRRSLAGHTEPTCLVQVKTADEFILMLSVSSGAERGRRQDQQGPPPLSLSLPRAVLLLPPVQVQHQVSDFVPFPPDLMPREPGLQVERELEMHHRVLQADMIYCS